MIKKLIYTVLLLPLLAMADTSPDDPCLELLSVLNRPTVADSVCAVKPGNIIIEGGFQYQMRYPDEGHAYNFPDLQLRFGVPGTNEITLLPPVYIREYGSDNGSDSGDTAPVIGFKHQFASIGKFSYAGESLLTFPTGSPDFGSDGVGIAINGIVNYILTDTVSAEFMIGYTSLTASSNAGGGRYSSINPDLVVAWQPMEMLQFYTEFYGQSRTSPDETDGYNADAGIQYLPTQHIELDIEYGHRLNGQLGGFDQYIGTGMGVRF